jgi:hypothetical protein
MQTHEQRRIGPHGTRRAQGGQALVEAYVVLAVLASLWLAVAWLGRLQDLGLQLAHASRRVAFAHAHQGLDVQALAPGVDGYLQAEGHRWATRAGVWLLSSPGLPANGGPDVLGGTPHAPAGAAAAVRWHVERTGLQPALQVGDPLAGAQTWRGQLGLGDDDIWRAVVSARTHGKPQPSGRLRDFDHLGLRPGRHTAILRGSGAAAGDTQVQATLGSSARAWHDLASVSQAAGQRAGQRLQGIDEAWGRASVSWDWLGPWTAWVPGDHLQPWREP